MKKSILTLFVMAFAIVSFAQKPQEGSLLTEARFNLASGIQNFEAPGLRFRYFIADDMAVRLDLGVNGSKSTDQAVDLLDDANVGENVMKTSGFSVGAGVEKHFGGNDRFSPYALFGLNYSTESETETWTDYNGGAYTKDYTADVIRMKENNLGVNVGLGGDYWIGKSFYLGAEFGFGFSSTTNPEFTSTYDDGTTSMDVTSQE
ncbi:MAG: hypothetical protein ACPGTP_06250, partial [Bacteroidia bacterium]